MVDTYTALPKQYDMMKLVYAFYEEGTKALKAGAKINDIVKLPVREQIGRFKYTKNEAVEEEYTQILEELTREAAGLCKKEDL